MYGQLDLEVISNLFKNEKRPSHFHEFWSEGHRIQLHVHIENIMFFLH